MESEILFYQRVFDLAKEQPEEYNGDAENLFKDLKEYCGYKGLQCVFNYDECQIGIYKLGEMDALRTPKIADIKFIAKNYGLSDQDIWVNSFGIDISVPQSETEQISNY